MVILLVFYYCICPRRLPDTALSNRALLLPPRPVLESIWPDQFVRYLHWMGVCSRISRDLSGNKFNHMSKTAFDTLPPFVTVHLTPPDQPTAIFAIESSYCCGLAWLLSTPSVSVVSNIICGNMPISYYNTTASPCACKSAQLQSLVPLCLDVLNITSTISGCAGGCPAGQRPYRTGPDYICPTSQASYTLFETACQGIRTTMTCSLI